MDLEKRLKVSSSIRNTIRSEVALLLRTRNLLNYRRINWNVIAQPIILQEFQEVCNQARIEHYPFCLFVQSYDNPNENTIQLKAGQNVTGAVKRETNFLTGLHYDTPVIEDSCSLVASQSVFGFIHFIVYPYSSERVKPNNENTILFRQLDPNEITPKLIRKAIERYLLIIRSSSVYGAYNTLSYKERLLLSWMRFQDVRNKQKLTTSLISLENKWGSAVVAALLAVIATYVFSASPNT